MTMLNLFAESLRLAESYRDDGRFDDALALLTRLAAFRTLPAEFAGDVHAMLGELRLRRRRFALARRHLRKALRHDATVARTFFLLGMAHHHDPHGDPRRASAAYRRALKLSPKYARCLCEAGTLAMEIGEVERGVKLLTKAVKLTPGRFMPVSRLIAALLDQGEVEDALSAVRKALFFAPKCPKLRMLWMRVQAEDIRARKVATAVEEEGPRIVPFLRPVGESGETRELRVRDDGAASLPGPHLVRMRRPSRRRAP